MADNLDLRLRVRVNADGSAQVLGGVGREIRQVGQQAAASNVQVRSFSDGLHSAADGYHDLSNRSHVLSSVLSRLNDTVISTSQSLLNAAHSAVYFGAKFNQVISNNLGIAADFANHLGGIKGGMLGLLALRDASAVDLFGGFAIRSGALGLQVKEAKDFESAFADVEKVVSGTSDELSELSRTIKDLASHEIPLPLSGLGDIAESGGQLGVATNQLEDYIQTVSRASVAFEMLPGDAGTAIGGLVNIFDEPLSAIKILLDQINVLGDSTAATERDILEVMRFVSGEGKRFGLMKGEIAALSATLLSLSKPPEIVRTALSGLFSALTTGEMRGDKFNESLSAMGMSADKLAADIQAKPTVALLNFLETLGSFNKLSQSKLLSGLFGLGTDAPAIGELASSLAMLKDNMAKVSDEAAVSGSTLRTFEARASTLDNKLQLATNSFHLFNIEAGAPFLATAKLAADAFHGVMDTLAQFAADHPAISAFIRITSLVGSLSLLLNSLRAIAPLAATAITGLSAAMASSTVALFVARFSAAGLAITLLTGVIGGLPSLALSAGVAIAMIGYNSVIAFTTAGASATVFGAVLTGVRTTMLTLVGAFGGGWIAAALIGISSLVVAWSNYKDEIYQIGDQQASLENIVIASFDVMYNGAVDYTSRIIEAFAKFPGSISAVWQQVAANTLSWLNKMRADNVLYIDSILDAHQRLVTFIVDSLPEPTAASVAKPSVVNKQSSATTDTSGIAAFADLLVEDFRLGVETITQDFFVKPVEQQLKLQADQQKKLQDANAQAVKNEIDARNKAYEEQKKNDLTLKDADMAGTHNNAATPHAKEAVRQLANEYERLVEQMQKELALSSDTKRSSAIEYEVTAGGLHKLNEAQKLHLLQLAAEVDNADISRKAADAQKSEVESLTQRYNELTMSARDAYIAQLKAKGISDEDIKKDLAEFDKIVGLQKAKTDTDAARQSLESYASSIDSAKNSMNDFGSIASSSLDGALGGVSAMAGAFANMISNINDSAVAMAALHTKQQELANFKPADKMTNPEQYAKDIKMQAELSKKFAAEQTALTHKATQATLAGYGQIAGAAKDLFDEQSSGYKALQAAEQAFRAFEIADAVMSYDTQGGLMNAFTQLFMTGKQAEQAADATATGQAVAQSQIRGQAKATEAVATQASAGPYIGFALMAAMAVAMAALGFNTGASSSASLSESRQETQGTGTVFGDAEAKSESISKAIETMKDVDLTMLPLTAQMAASLRNIESSLAGLGNLLIQANVANPEVAGLGTTSDTAMFLTQVFDKNVTKAGALIDPVGRWLTDAIFGKTTASVEDSGITIPKQSISDLMTNGLFAQQYADIKTETEYVFGLLSDSSMSRQLQTLSGQASDQLTKLMQSIVLSTEAAAGYLTGAPDAIKQQLANVVLDIGDISLKNLKGDELTDALNHVFSKAADDIAAQAFNELVPFQRVGEGYFETLVRVASGVEQASVSLQALNVPAIEYSNVINKQGDVFAELVRQSLVAVESLDGAANGVGQIITALDASGQDLLATYQSLVEVRNLMVASGISGSVLDASVIGGAGGLDPLKSALSTYQDAYFSEQEQLAAHTREMITAFAALNFVMPDSRAGFRDLVDGLDTSTAAGKVLLGQVLQLAEGFDTLQSQYESVLTSLEDNVTSAYDTASELLQNQIDMFSQYAKSLREFSDTLFNGQLSTATPEDKYRTAKGDFNAIQRVLTSGTAAQKADALPELQGVVQQFLDNSRAFNGGSLTYMRDLAAAQALLGQSINYADGQKDVATQQLTALTQQLTALGLIKTSVDDVTTAVNAVGIALAGLDAFKAAQDQSKVKTANEAAFDKIESTRKQAYEATIADKAGVIGTSAARYEGMVGFSAGTSKNPFSAAGTVDVSTGAVTSDVVTTSGGHYAGDIASSLQSDIFPRVAGSLKLVATKLQSMLGGVLPSVALKFGDDEAYGAGFYEYAFADITRRVNSDQIALMERAFANDVTDYLADQLTNTAWIDAVKSVEFSSLGSGFTALAATLAKLKNPYQAGQYDPTIDYTTKLDGLKTFALGGIATTASIFGEAGPEAAVPLPDGRTIPVTFTGLPDWLISPPGQRQNSSAGGSDDGALLKALQDVQRELAELRKLAESQNKHAAASVAVQQAGYQQMIANLESQVAALGEQVRATRIKADAS